MEPQKECHRIGNGEMNQNRRIIYNFFREVRVNNFFIKTLCVNYLELIVVKQIKCIRSTNLLPDREFQRSWQNFGD